MHEMAMHAYSGQSKTMAAHSTGLLLLSVLLPVPRNQSRGMARKRAVPAVLLMSAGQEARAEWELPIEISFRGIPACNQLSLESVLITRAALGMTTETSEVLQWHLLKLPCHA